MTEILDPLVYGLPPPVRVIRKGQTVKVDAFKGIRILEVIRVEWGEDWFTTRQLVNWLQTKSVDEEMDGIRIQLKRLVAKELLKKSLRSVQGKRGMLKKPHYALGKISEEYLKKYRTFFNPQGNLFKNKLRLYQKIKSGHAAVV